MDVGVLVGVGSRVGVGSKVGVLVAVTVGVGCGVAVAVAVVVDEGVDVGLGVGVAVAVGVFAVGDAVGVTELVLEQACKNVDKAARPPNAASICKRSLRLTIEF